MNDFIIKSCIAGMVSFLYKNIGNHILYYLGFTQFLYRIEAAMVVLPAHQANTLSGALIGFFTDLVLLIWVALIIGYILRTTGFDYALVKGGFVGASSWLAMYGFFAHTGIVGQYKPSGINSGLTTIFFDITMGIVSAYVYVYLNNREKLIV